MSASRINISISIETYHAIRHALGFACQQQLQSIEDGKTYRSADYGKALLEVESFRLKVSA